MRLIEGQIIHRRYRLDALIAHGGMGEVWKAWDTILHRTVAVKVLRSDVLADRQHLERLRMEAHNSADLAHPNIAALFDYYEEDGAGFIVMEYVPNESLAQIYKREKRMEPTKLLAILSQVARGLYVAHERGVIHRDVKPANIMVAPNGQVKITDFGVSYSTNQAPITAAGMVVGTAQYISPEQAQGKTATPQSDIYSLGVVAYEGLAGHRPFTGATPVDIAAAQVNDPVPPLPADVDPELRDYVMQMLAKDPGKRPRNALLVSHEFSRIEQRLIDAHAQQGENSPNPEGSDDSDEPQRQQARRQPTPPLPHEDTSGAEQRAPRPAPRPVSRPIPSPTPAPARAPHEDARATARISDGSLPFPAPDAAARPTRPMRPLRVVRSAAHAVPAATDLADGTGAPSTGHAPEHVSVSARHSALHHEPEHRQGFFQRLNDQLHHLQKEIGESLEPSDGSVGSFDERPENPDERSEDPGRPPQDSRDSEKRRNPETRDETSDNEFMGRNEGETDE